MDDIYDDINKSPQQRLAEITAITKLEQIIKLKYPHVGNTLIQT